MLVFHCKHDEERQSERERERNRKRERQRQRKRETEREREKASKEIKNDAEVEYTLIFVADRIGISGV